MRHRLAGTDVILLASFVNKTGDPVFDNSLDKALEVKLTESPFFSVLPEADVRATMRTMRHDPNERVTQELGIEICKRQGLKAVVVPEIDAMGGEYLITLEAIDAQNQKSIARRQAEAQSKEKVIAALGKAGSQLRTRLGESSSSLEKYDAPLDLATTSSLEALQAYRTGQTLYRAGKRREASPFLKGLSNWTRSFVRRYSMLGSAYHSVGDGQGRQEEFRQGLRAEGSPSHARREFSDYRPLLFGHNRRPRKGNCCTCFVQGGVSAQRGRLQPVGDRVRAAGQDRRSAAGVLFGDGPFPGALGSA